MADITSQDADLKQETPDVIAEVSTSAGAIPNNPDPQLSPSQGTRSTQAQHAFTLHQSSAIPHANLQTNSLYSYQMSQQNQTLRYPPIL